MEGALSWQLRVDKPFDGRQIREVNTTRGVTPLLGFPSRAPSLDFKSPHFLSKSAPLELLGEILQYCNTMSDVLSFALTCRRMQEAWRAGQIGLRVAWGLVKRQVPVAELALIAVRASRLASDAHTNWSDGTNSPPGIVLAELYSRCRLPSVVEIKAVQDLHMVVVAFVENFHDRCICDDDRRYFQGAVPAVEEHTIERAMYRAFIAGAILAPLYAQPLRLAQEHQDVEISRPRRPSGNNRPKFAQFLRQFPSYQARLEPQRDHELFGHFGSWLLDDILSDTISRAAMMERFALGYGRALGCERRSHEPQPGDDQDRPCPVRLPNDCGYTHADAHLVALELARVYWICHVLQEYDILYYHVGPSVGMHGSYGPLLLWHRFVPQTIYLHPPDPDSGYESSELVLDDANAKAGDNVDAAMHEAALLDFDQWRARAAQGVYLPPLAYKFFAYFLQRHLDAAFEPGFFEEDEMGVTTSHWREFTYTMRIFMKDDGDNPRTYYPRGVGMDFRNADILDGTDILVPWSPRLARVYGVEDGHAA